MITPGSSRLVSLVQVQIQQFMYILHYTYNVPLRLVGLGHQICVLNGVYFSLITSSGDLYGPIIGLPISLDFVVVLSAVAALLVQVRPFRGNSISVYLTCARWCNRLSLCIDFGERPARLQFLAFLQF